jgi:hypothetical protein
MLQQPHGGYPDPMVEVVTESVDAGSPGRCTNRFESLLTVGGNWRGSVIMQGFRGVESCWIGIGTFG